jgi:hypothetical protein
VDGGRTCAAASPTLRAKTEIASVPVGMLAPFRYRTITKTGAGDWSQSIALLVK